MNTPQPLLYSIKLNEQYVMHSLTWDDAKAIARVLGEAYCDWKFATDGMRFVYDLEECPDGFWIHRTNPFWWLHREKFHSRVSIVHNE